MKNGIVFGWVLGGTIVVMISCKEWHVISLVFDKMDRCLFFLNIRYFVFWQYIRPFWVRERAKPMYFLLLFFFLLNKF